MSSNSDFFLKKALGNDFLESLQKFELYKPGTKTVLDHEEIKTALMIVPRALMSFLIYHLSAMNIGDYKETQIPIAANGAMLHITKHERDVYSGEILEDNKKVVEFKHRSIPGVGLIIMSAFELYDTSKLVNPPKEAANNDLNDKVQKLIDERLALHDLIGKVVDKKLLEREAIHKLMMMKLTEAVHENSLPKADPIHEPMMASEKIKGSEKLKKFIEYRKEKKKPQEFAIEMAKGEKVDCPDCGKNIFDGVLFSGCICLGDDRDKKIFIKKNEKGISVRFGKSWDPENVEMLVEVLRRKRGQ